MKCWNSAFNVQGWRVIVVVIQVGVMEVFMKKEKHDEIQFMTKIVGNINLGPNYFVL
jgi:hypothetical protein